MCPDPGMRAIRSTRRTPAESEPTIGTSFRSYAPDASSSRRMTFAGTSAAKLFGGTSFVTTDPAPTTEFSRTVTPPSIVAPRRNPNASLNDDPRRCAAGICRYPGAQRNAPGGRYQRRRARVGRGRLARGLGPCEHGVRRARIAFHPNHTKAAQTKNPPRGGFFAFITEL